MIELLTSGMLGSGVGLLKNVITARGKANELKEIRKASQDEKQSKAISDFINGQSDKPYFIGTVWMLTATVCLSILACINFPSIPLVTIPPDAKPRVLDFYLFKYSWQSTQTIIVTTGGVAYDLLKVALFHIGLVLTSARR